MTLWDDIYSQIQALAVAVLPAGTPVIEGRQGKPAPDGPHLVIMPNPQLSLIGQASEVVNDDVTVRYFDWVGPVEIRELDGDGDLLRLLLQGTDRSTVKNYLQTVSFLSSSEVQDLSFQEGDKWVKELRMDFRITIRTKEEETLGYIETLGLSWDIAGHTGTADIPA